MFSITDFFSKCDQIRRKLRIWSHLLKKSLMENFIFVLHTDLATSNDHKNRFNSSNKSSYCWKNLLILEKAAVFPSLLFMYLMINIPINKFNKRQVEICVVLYNLSQLLEMHTITTLIRLFPIHPFSTTWNHQKTAKFSNVFRGYRKDALGTNRLKCLQ